MKKQLYQNQAKIQELESIRGLAAFLIIFYHIPKWNSLLDIGIINNSYLMVDLFFILSGFLIYKIYSEKICCTKDLYRFQFLRFGRLYPVHLVFLLAFLLIEIVKYFAERKLGLSNIRSLPFSENCLGALIKQAFLFHAILPSNDAATFNGPAWSISVEFYTYLIFGLLILFFKSQTVKVIGFLTISSLLMLSTNYTLGFDNLLRCLSGFFLGCLTARVINKSTIHLTNYLSTIVFISIILFLQFKTPKSLDGPIYFLIPILIFSIMLNRNGFLNKVLNIKILTWLGVISYSVYMSHSLVLWVITSVFKRIFKRTEIPNTDGIYVLQLTPVETISGCFSIIIMVLLVSQITYEFIEKPFREKSRKIAFEKLN